MYDSYINLFWKIDRILLVGLTLLGTGIVFYALLTLYSANRRNRALANIKKNIHNLAVTGQKPSDAACPMVNTETAQQFLDVEMNRQAVLFNEAEQKFIKECLARSNKISHLKKIAKRSKDKWRRIEALLSLGYAEDDSSLEIFKNSLFDKDKDISYFSMIALSMIRDVLSAKILLDFLKRDISNSYKIVSILESFPASIVDEVIKMAGDPNPRVRYWAIKLISKFKPERYIKRIEDLTSDESSDVRAAACECLGKIGERGAKDAILKGLKDNTWFVRMHAVRALSSVLGDECIPEVIGLIEDNSLFVKESVKMAMIDHIETALPYIEKILKGEDEIAKKESIEALESSGYIIKLLKGVLSKENKERSHAINLLKEMIKGSAHFGLETALGDFEQDSRVKVLEAIKDIDKAFAEHIEKRLNQQLNEL